VTQLCKVFLAAGAGYALASGGWVIAAILLVVLFSAGNKPCGCQEEAAA
jgi:hypothetical protein